MPDISMCPSDDCPVRGDCYRNEASGTQPCEWWQSWMAWTWQGTDEGQFACCDGYWPMREPAPLPPSDQSAGGGR